MMRTLVSGMRWVWAKLRAPRLSELTAQVTLPGHAIHTRPGILEFGLGSALSPLGNPYEGVFYDPQARQPGEMFFDVFKFHRKFELVNYWYAPGHLTQRKLKERIAFLKEELTEFTEAATEQNLIKQFDALLDIVYVAMGTAVMMGLPWDEGWRVVQRCNLAKARGSGGEGRWYIDVIKPPGWTPPEPELAQLLAMHGYRRENWWLGPNHQSIDDQRCRDDAHHKVAL